MKSLVPRGGPSGLNAPATCVFGGMRGIHPPPRFDAFHGERRFRTVETTALRGPFPRAPEMINGGECRCSGAASLCGSGAPTALSVASDPMRRRTKRARTCVRTVETCEPRPAATAPGQDFLAVAEREADIEPDGVPDDLGRDVVPRAGDGLHAANHPPAGPGSRSRDNAVESLRIHCLPLLAREQRHHRSKARLPAPRAIATHAAARRNVSLSLRKTRPITAAKTTLVSRRAEIGPIGPDVMAQITAP